MKKTLPAFAAFLLTVLSLLSFAGRLNGWGSLVGYDRFKLRNEGYLETTFKRSMQAFGVMSGLKAGLAVLEGSTGGISAGLALNVEVGDVVQSAYDYVDIAWRTLFAGCICLLSLQYLLEAAELVDHLLLGAFLLLLALGLLWRPAPKPLRDARLVSFFSVWMILFVLPLSITLSSVLSEKITRSGLESAQEGFTAAEASLFPEEPGNRESLFRQIRSLPEQLENVTAYLSDKASEMALWTIQLIAGYLFDCILFPVGSFLGLLWLSRCFFRYCRECDLHRTLHREISRLQPRSSGKSS